MYDFQEACKLVNEAYKKAGVPWRSVWVTSIFGEMGTYVTVAPVQNMAQFDSDSPIMKMSDADRTKYITLMRNSVESGRYSLVQYVPSLSLNSNRTEMPKLARITSVKVLPGKNVEFEELIQSTLIPAVKKAGGKDYWVHRTTLGGEIGEYTIVQLFEKWEEMGAWPSTDKLLGPAGYKQFLSKISQTVSRADNMAMRVETSLSYSAPK
jgi:hypothetical protein